MLPGAFYVWPVFSVSDVAVVQAQRTKCPFRPIGWRWFLPPSEDLSRDVLKKDPGEDFLTRSGHPPCRLKTVASAFGSGSLTRKPSTYEPEARSDCAFATIADK
jgi:hypothetical protein